MKALGARPAWGQRLDAGPSLPDSRGISVAPWAEPFVVTDSGQETLEGEPAFHWRRGGLTGERHPAHIGTFKREERAC